MQNKDFIFNYINKSAIKEYSELEKFYLKYKDFSQELKKVINSKDEQLEFFQELKEISSLIGAKPLVNLVNDYYVSLNSSKVENALLIDISFEVKHITSEIQLYLK